MVKVLGTRTITNSKGDAVEVVIFHPEMDSDGHFFCEFSLNGLSWSGKMRRSYGIDAIQSIYLAMQSIGSDLEALNQREVHDLNWVGGSYKDDFGLPTIDK